MLEMRLTCENCRKPLQNESDDAMICSYECTFCKDCVENILENVCPNCGGGFTNRPTRPNKCITSNCIKNDPVSEKEIHKPIDKEKFKRIYNEYVNLDPRKR